MGRRVSFLIALTSLLGCTEITRTDFEPEPLAPGDFGSGGNPDPTPGNPRDDYWLGSVGIDPHFGGQIAALTYGPYGVYPDGELGLVLAGTDSRPTTMATPGGTDLGITVMRLAPDGSVEWSRWLASQLQGFPFVMTFGGAVVDAEGNTYVAGGFSGSLSAGNLVVESTVNPGTSTDPLDLAGRSSQDIFLLKLDRQGQVLWLQRFGGVGQQNPVTLSLAPDGTLVMTGTFTGELELGDFAFVSTAVSTGYDVVMARFDAQGSVLSARQFDTDQIAIAAADVDSQGNLLLCGRGYGDARLVADAELVLPPGGWVIKFTPSFDPLWSSSFDDVLGPEARAIAVDHLDNIVVAADSHGDESLYGEPLGEKSMVLVKLDAAGSRVFSLATGRNGVLDTAASVTILNDNGIALTGSFFGAVDFGGGPLHAFEQGVHSDVFVTSLSESGEHRWTLVAGGYGSDFGMSIAALPSNRLVTTGYFPNAINFGSGLVPWQGGPYVAWIQP